MTLGEVRPVGEGLRCSRRAMQFRHQQESGQAGRSMTAMPADKRHNVIATAGAVAFALWLAGCTHAPRSMSQPAPASVPITHSEVQPLNAPLMAAAVAEQPAVVKTLERLVNVETGTGDAEGLAEITRLLEHELRALGASVTRHPPEGASVGDTLVGRIRGTGSRRLLLMAHMDTVYPRGALGNAPFRVEGNRAYGPGIADAKGGIAVVLHALRLLRAEGFKDHGPITVMFNPDEERGSLGSRALIQRLAAEADAVLSFEPTSVGQELLTMRTAGIVYYRVKVTGLAAHAGANPEEGVNALVEAADIVRRTVGLDEPTGDVRFNWTLARAGTAANVVPDSAELEANIRYLHEDRLATLLQTLERRIQGQKRLGAAKISIAVERGRPPFIANEGSRRLIEKAIRIYREAGATLEVIPYTGGATDAGYAALSGKPVIEGLGLPGDGVHNDRAEYVTLDAVPRRLYLAARMVMDLSQGR